MGDQLDYATEHGLDLLREARSEIGEAKLGEVISGPTAAAEQHARKALELYRSVMNWLEDTKYFEAVHEQMDKAGAYIRRTFDCYLAYENGEYSQRCPLALAHNRIGMSPTMLIDKVECSICGQDPDDCEHIGGRMYNGERCLHKLSGITFVGVSLVSRPAQPDARFSEVPVSFRELKEQFGPRLERGIQVHCDRCLSRCDGVVEPFRDGGLKRWRDAASQSQADRRDDPGEDLLRLRRVCPL